MTDKRTIDPATEEMLEIAEANTGDYLKQGFWIVNLQEPHGVEMYSQI